MITISYLSAALITFVMLVLGTLIGIFIISLLSINKRED